MRSHESLDEFSIGFGEFIRVKIGRFHPSTLGNFDGARLSARDGAVEEMKFDRLCRIVMRGDEKFVDDIRLDIELFAQLPSQRGFQRFAGFNFAAGKFPEVRQMDVCRALRQQDVLVSMNDCRHDDDHKDSLCAVATRRWFPVWFRTPTLS